MSEIKAGDLVVIVRRRACGCDVSVGMLYRVCRVAPALLHGRCLTCAAVTFERGTLIAFKDDRSACELSRLKKIDPLAESEHIEHREELPA